MRNLNFLGSRCLTMLVLAGHVKDHLLLYFKIQITWKEIGTLGQPIRVEIFYIQAIAI